MQVGKVLTGAKSRYRVTGVFILVLLVCVVCKIEIISK